MARYGGRSGATTPGAAYIHDKYRRGGAERKSGATPVIWCAPMGGPLIAGVLAAAGGWGTAIPLERGGCDAAAITVTVTADVPTGYVGWATWDPTDPAAGCAIKLAPAYATHPAIINHEFGHCLMRVEGHPTVGVLSGATWWPTDEELRIAMEANE